MKSKTFVTAFIATCLMAGSDASPCRVTSRTTGISTSVTVTSAETATTTDEASITTTTALSTTDLSSTGDLSVTITESESESSTVTSAASDATTTALSTTQGTSTEELTSTATESATTSAESAATTTIDGTATTTTTEAGTTTTTESPAGTSFIANGGFDDSAQYLEPWDLSLPDGVAGAVDNNIKHDGPNSAALEYTESAASFLRQPFQQPIVADVEYTMSAWVRATAECTRAYINCVYDIAAPTTVSYATTYLGPSAAGTWQYMSGICTYTQGQIDNGGLALYVGLACASGARANIDTVIFTP